MPSERTKILRCAEEGCRQTMVYSYANQREYTEILLRQKQWPYKCTRHQNPEQVLSPDNMTANAHGLIYTTQGAMTAEDLEEWRLDHDWYEANRREPNEDECEHLRLLIDDCDDCERWVTVDDTGHRALLEALHEALDTPSRTAFATEQDYSMALMERCASLRGILTSVLRNGFPDIGAETVRKTVKELDERTRPSHAAGGAR